MLCPLFSGCGEGEGCVTCIVSFVQWVWGGGGVCDLCCVLRSVGVGRVKGV